MTINNTNYNQVDSDLFRAICLDIKMYFYSFMGYSDLEISDIMNKDMVRMKRTVKVSPELVCAVRAGKL